MSDIPGRDANWPRLTLYKDRSKASSGCKEGSGPCKIPPKGSYHHIRIEGVIPGVCQWREIRGHLEVL